MNVMTVKKISTIIGNNNIFLLLSSIIILHGCIVGYYIERGKQSVLAEYSHANLLIVKSLAEGLRNTPPEILDNVLKKLKNLPLSLQSDHFIVTISSSPEFGIVVFPINEKNYTDQFSLAINERLWLNYKVNSREGNYFLLYIFTFVGLLIVAIYFFHVLSIYRLRVPLKNFQSSAQRLGIDINSSPVKVRGPVFVQEIANAMNLMQLQLQEAMTKRTRLLASISHDLRTPLTRLKLRLNALENDVELGAIFNDIDEIESMMNSILGFAYNDVLREQKSQFDIISLIFSLCEDFADQGYNVLVKSDTQNLTFFGSKLALKRAFTNFVQNGIKYGKNVLVQITTNNNEVAVSVEDDGPGVPIKELVKVLDPYFRSSDPQSQQMPGTGLGLSIANEIILAHRGKIVLSNRIPHGLLVLVTLPKNPL